MGRAQEDYRPGKIDSARDVFGQSRGVMTKFYEKQEDLGTLLRLFYDAWKRSDKMYKNPVNEFFDKGL